MHSDRGAFCQPFIQRSFPRALAAVQAGFRTRHIKTVAITAVRRNVTHTANLHAGRNVDQLSVEMIWHDSTTQSQFSVGKKKGERLCPVSCPKCRVVGAMSYFMLTFAMSGGVCNVKLMSSRLVTNIWHKPNEDPSSTLSSSLLLSSFMARVLHIYCCPSDSEIIIFNQLTVINRLDVSCVGRKKGLLLLLMFYYHYNYFFFIIMKLSCYSSRLFSRWRLNPGWFIQVLSVKCGQCPTRRFSESPKP